MTDNNQFSDDSFESLFKQSSQEQTRLVPGQKMKAPVTSISEQFVFIDAGGKGEGSIDINEFIDESGVLQIKAGDSIEAYFLSSQHNELLFTTKFGAGSVSTDHLRQAFANGIPVEGLVQKEIKGGYEITISSTRAFCPFSQIDLRQNDDKEAFIGERFAFKIIEYEDSGRKANIILSRRALLEEERLQQKEELKQTLKEGMAINGVITSIKDFGAFADIGGVDGMIPISEIGWGRVNSVHDELSIGQEVETVILKIDWATDRITLSLRRALPDPWETATSQFPAGSTHTGTVVRLMQFGAFVNLAPGIDGLIHISKLGKGKKLNHPREAVSEGETVEVYVEQVDLEKKRISLELAAAREEEAAEQKEEKDLRTMLEQRSKKESKSMGTLGDQFMATLKKKKG